MRFLSSSRVAVVLVLLALLGTACSSQLEINSGGETLVLGGDDADRGSVTSPEDQEFIDALSANVSSQNTDEFAFSEEESNCLASALVRGLGGADRIENKYEISLEMVKSGEDFDNVALDPDDADAVMDGYWPCIDWEDLLKSGFVAEGLPEQDAICVAEAMDLTVFRETIRADLIEDPILEESANGALLTQLGELEELCGI